MRVIFFKNKPDKEYLMPGLIHHLTCAKLVLRNMNEQNWNETEFYMGNLIPDMGKDKSKSHYRREPFNGWDVPDLALVKADCLYKDNALLMGVYCHLYLDYFYTHFYLGKKYRLEGDKVIQCKNNVCCCDVKYFRSENGIYGDYSATNERLIRSGLAPWKEINELSAKLPLTGVAALDDRKELGWKEEFFGYLSQPSHSFFQFLNYDEFVEMIQRGAESFLKEIE